MNSTERREKLLGILEKSDSPITGRTLAAQLGVSRQVIVQDIMFLRALNHEIISTTDGYSLNGTEQKTRVFKVVHTEEQMEDEMNLIVDLGGEIKDVMIYHKVYGLVKGNLGIKSRRDVSLFMEAIRSGKSTVLMSATSGYHYHTVSAASDLLLDLIHEKLRERGYLAKLQDFEPVDFWKNSEETKE